MSNLYFPSQDTRYGFEIFSTMSKKLSNKSIGLLANSDFNIVLINNTSNNVKVNIRLNGQYIGSYEVIQHSTYKLLNLGQPNQFFKFYPKYSDPQTNTNFSELELEWIPVYSRTYMKNKGLYDNVNFYRGYPTKYLTQTQLSYDKRINYGCVNSGYPLNTFTTDLNLGISSDKYAIKQKYIDSSNSIYQKINLIALNPYYDVVNVRDYFVYNEPHLDVFEHQRLDKII
jgi:hypothetical protein